MTVPLSAMPLQPVHVPLKRLPAPATTTLPPTQPLLSTERLRRCSPRRSPAVQHLQRLAILLVFAAVLLVLSSALIAHPARPSLWFALRWPTLVDVRRFLKRSLRLYQRQLHLHPLSSRAITAGVIFFIADFSAQVLNRPPGKSPAAAFSISRLGRYSVYGLLVMGPFLYVWYEVMNEYGPEDDFKGSLLKCLFEQITLEPICISMYIIYDGFVCNRGMRQIRTKMESNFLPLLLKNAIFWLPANFANYYIGTPDLRVIFANLCSLFWNIYFSAKINKASVPAFTVKGDKYVPLSNHDRSQPHAALAKSADQYQRRAGDTSALARPQPAPRTLIV